MNLNLNNKKAIVTGGSGDLCSAMAQALYDAGADVVLVDASDKVYETAKQMETKENHVYAVKQDLSTQEGVTAAYNESLAHLGGHLDILLNGVGIQYRCPAKDFPADKWLSIIQINLNSIFFLSQLAGNTMLEQNYGKIINIASMTSFFGSVNIPAYSASKGAVAQLTKALSNEWASSGINVNAIAPGYMSTQLTANMKTTNPQQYEEITNRIPARRWGTGEDLKGTVVFLASEASAYISGAIIPVDGGFLGK